MTYKTKSFLIAFQLILSISAFANPEDLDQQVLELESLRDQNANATEEIQAKKETEEELKKRKNRKTDAQKTYEKRIAKEARENKKLKRKNQNFDFRRQLPNGLNHRGNLILSTAGKSIWTSDEQNIHQNRKLGNFHGGTAGLSFLYYKIPTGVDQPGLNQGASQEVDVRADLSFGPVTQSKYPISFDVDARYNLSYTFSQWGMACQGITGGEIEFDLSANSYETLSVRKRKSGTQSATALHPRYEFGLLCKDTNDHSRKYLVLTALGSSTLGVYRVGGGGGGRLRAGYRRFSVQLESLYQVEISGESNRTNEREFPEDEDQDFGFKGAYYNPETQAYEDWSRFKYKSLEIKGTLHYRVTQRLYLGAEVISRHLFDTEAEEKLEHRFNGPKQILILKGLIGVGLF